METIGSFGATISSGMIGGGVNNFGPWLGPPAAALLMAVWVAALRGSISRGCGLGGSCSMWLGSC